MTTTAQILDALLAYRTGYAGQRWNFREVLGSSGVSSGAGIGQGVNLTYSFPATLPAYWAPPPGQAPYYTNFTALNTIQADAARSVFAHYAAVTNLVFTESASTGNANIAIGRTTNGFGPGVGGYAYSPSFSATTDTSNNVSTVVAVNEAGDGTAGDVWLNADYFVDPDAAVDFARGGGGYESLMHEIGHAVGMKHPFSPSVTLPAELDNTGFTVMAYTAPAHGWVVTVTGNANSYGFSSSLIQPRTLMLGDMLALQATYGANASTRTGSDNYSWQPGERFLETLWDAGGVDTIDASNQTLGNVISLVAGTYSSIGLRRTHTELMADFPAFARASIAMAFTDAELHDGSNNLAIAYGVEIENAIGGAGADLITGNSLANRLTGGAGNDSLDGGAGQDIASYSGSRSAYTITRDVPNARFVVTALSGPDGTDQVKNVELLQFADSTTVLASLASDTGIVDGFNTYRYLASNADLLAAFGSNAPVALAHFINQGYGEGRGFAAFNAVAYLASNPDLLAVYGPNPGAATEHFVRWGNTEGRPTASFDAYAYLASNPDVLGAYGPNPAGATEHFVYWGRAEGRPTASFDGFAYLASNPDVLAAYGPNRGAAAEHFVRWGNAEGRATSSFDAFGYLASNPDVRAVYGPNPGAATEHFVRWGNAEGRSTASFDAFEYLASNLDVLAVYGPNRAGAAEHFVRWGNTEGRSTASFDAIEYLASNLDVLTALGPYPAAGAEHFVRYGVGEQRAIASFNALQYHDNYGDLEGASLAAARLNFVNGGYVQGRGDQALLFNLAGTPGNDVSSGNAAANVLNGGPGNDTLTGGHGMDQFVFDSAPGASTNLDRVMDFTPGVDKLVLDHAIFTQLAAGSLAAGRLAASPAGNAQDADDYLAYNTQTGLLSYDADGSGVGAAIPFATLASHPLISAADFVVI